MQLHPTLDKFYLSVLAYAGMRYDGGIVKSNNEQINDLSIDGKFLTLPYFDNLKNPQDRHIFHPLNESYNSPETVFIAAYKKRLTLDINMRVFGALHALLRVGVDVALQRKVKSPQLLHILSEMKEVDPTLLENFVSIIKHSQKKNAEAFVVDFHVKKNGQLKDVSYAAIGKVNFILYKELNRALDDNADGYKVFGARVRKKDILSLISLFNLIFDGIEDEDVYSVGVDNKTFRFFGALLQSSCLVAFKVNEVATLLKDLKEPDLDVDSLMSDVQWTQTLEEVNDLTSEIRSIPNQTNAQTEGRAAKAKVHPQATYTTPSIPQNFDANVQRSQYAPEPPPPPAPPQHANPHQYAPQQPQTPPQYQAQPAMAHAPQQPPSAEDIIRNSVHQQQMYDRQNFAPAYNNQHPGYPPQQGYPNQQQGYYQQPGYPPQHQGYPQPQQPVYPQPQGYPPQQPMYPNQQQGYPQPQPPGYPPAQGYPPQHRPMTAEEALRNLPSMSPQYNVGY